MLLPDSVSLILIANSSNVTVSFCMDYISRDCSINWVKFCNNSRSPKAFQVHYDHNKQLHVHVYMYLNPAKWILNFSNTKHYTLYKIKSMLKPNLYLRTKLYMFSNFAKVWHNWDFVRDFIMKHSWTCECMSRTVATNYLNVQKLNLQIFLGWKRR
jgi:hypothetical protein